MITLSTGRLRVEIAEPGEAPNNGFRFDRTGYISEVVLDGMIHFCASEPKNLVHPPTGGRGLCSELICDLSQEITDGYYPKFGVGLIPADGTPYVFHRKYQGVIDFPTQFTVKEDEVDFELSPVFSHGYALSEKKSVKVQDNMLTVTYTLENTGEKTIVLSEYCHNFLSIDGMAISPDYHLAFPALKDFQKLPVIGKGGKPNNLIGDGHGFSFVKADTTVSRTEVSLDGMHTDADIFTWRLFHVGAKAYVEGTEHFIPDSITLWTVDHMICPEIFHRVSISPGEQSVWKRNWCFGWLG